MSLFDQEDLEFLVKHENEALIEGRPVITIITDYHEDHIDRHRKLLTDSRVMTDPEVIERVLDHINHHVKMMKKKSNMLYGE